MTLARKYAVIGHPIHHSKSPAMHTAAFAQCGITATYEAIDIDPHAADSIITDMRNQGFNGINITIPYKETVLSQIDTIDTFAQRAGAVNTVLFDETGSHGYNTDGYGFITDFKDHFTAAPLTNASVALFGAGGAARAIAAQLLTEPLMDIFIVNRTVARAEKLVAALAPIAGERSITLTALPLTESLFNDMYIIPGIIINTTSLGLHPDDVCPVDFYSIPRTGIVYDIVYGSHTPCFCAAAHTAGWKTASGQGMLVHQAARAFTLWTGKKAPIKEMFQACIN